MFLTVKSKYAVIAMLHLAKIYKDTKAKKEEIYPVKISEIAEELGIDLAYLEQIFNKLIKSQLIKSVRGAKGGYLLNKEANKITILEIIDSVSEIIKMRSCNDENENGCMKKGVVCSAHMLWFGLEKHISQYLSSINIEDVISENIK